MRRCSSPNRAVSKADRQSAVQPSRLAPNSNPRHHNHKPSSLESRGNLQPGRAVAHIPAEPAERSQQRYLPVRTNSPKEELEIEIQLKPTNAISSFSLS